MPRAPRQRRPSEGDPDSAKPAAWKEADLSTALGVYFKHLAGPSHRAVSESLAHIQIVSAAQGTGKTTLMLAEAAALFCNCHPTRKRTRAVNILVMAPSRAQLAAIYGQRLLAHSELVLPEELREKDALKKAVNRPFIPMTAIAMRESGKPDITWAASTNGRGPGLIVHEDGTRLFFAISGDRNAWMRIESNNFDAIFRDEAVGDTDMGETLRTRLRQSWDDTTSLTGGGFYKWYFSELKLNTEAMDAVRRSKRNDDHHAYLPLALEDNRAVSLQTRQEIGSTMSKGAANRRLFGTESLFNQVLIFGNQFSRERHILKSHHEPSLHANLLCAWDPGMRHPYGLLFGCIEPEKPYQIIIWAAALETGTTIDHQANVIAQMLGGRFLSRFFYDPSGAVRREYGNAQRLCDSMEEALRVRGVKVRGGLEPGANAYDVTLNAVWRYLNPDPKNPNAEPLLVVNPPSPSAPGVDEFLEGIFRYQWKDAGNRSLSRDAVLTQDDELASCLRYLCAMEPKYVDRGPNPRTVGSLAAPSGIPYPIHRAADPLGDDAGLPEAERRQRAMLRESRETALRWSRRNQRGYVGASGPW